MRLLDENNKELARTQNIIEDGNITKYMFSDDCYAQTECQDNTKILTLHGFEEFLDFDDGGMCFYDDIMLTEYELKDNIKTVQLQHIGDEGVPLEMYVLEL